MVNGFWDNCTWLGGILIIRDDVIVSHNVGKNGGPVRGNILKDEIIAGYLDCPADKEGKISRFSWVCPSPPTRPGLLDSQSLPSDLGG